MSRREVAGSGNRADEGRTSNRCPKNENRCQ
jgi:hypothetical protein